MREVILIPKAMIIFNLYVDKIFQIESYACICIKVASHIFLN